MSRKVRRRDGLRTKFRSVGQSFYVETERDRGEVWVAPDFFDISDVRRRQFFLRSLHFLRTKIGKKREKVILDFSRTQYLHASATLLFLAELRRLMRIVGGGIEIGCRLPNNAKVSQAFQQIGLYSLLGVKVPIIPVDNDVINWRAANGNKVMGEKYEDVLAEYNGEITDVLQDKLYAGITEAMTNVINHAYDLPRGDGLECSSEKEWWMFSEQKDGKLTVVFCDLGAGIPKTLPYKRQALWKKILSLGNKNDAEIIKHAVQDSVSRTMEDHRGRGLGQIVKVLQGVPGSAACIYSNRGAYRVRTDFKEDKRCYRDSIYGTLIHWNIPLETREEI